VSPAIFVVLAVAATSDTSATQEVVKAYAAHERIDKQLHVFYETSFSKGSRQKLGLLASATRIAAEQRIVIRWEFP
jgi:hypothetical protein